MYCSPLDLSSDFPPISSTSETRTYTCTHARAHTHTNAFYPPPLPFVHSLPLSHTLTHTLSLNLTLLRTSSLAHARSRTGPNAIVHVRLQDLEGERARLVGGGEEPPVRGGLGERYGRETARARASENHVRMITRGDRECSTIKCHARMITTRSRNQTTTTGDEGGGGGGGGGGGRGKLFRILRKFKERYSESYTRKVRFVTRMRSLSAILNERGRL